MINKTKSQKKFLNQIGYIFTIILMVIIAIPVTLYLVPKFSRNKGNSDIVQMNPNIKTIGNSLKIEVDVQDQKWNLIKEQESGDEINSDRQLTFIISYGGNNINISIKEFKSITDSDIQKSKEEKLPNGELTKDKYLNYQEIDIQDVVTIYEDLNGQRIVRGKDLDGNQGQIIFDINNKKEGIKDQKNKDIITPVLYNTSIELFPNYKEKYNDRELRVEVDYSIPLNSNYTEYDQILKSIKLLN